MKMRDLEKATGVNRETIRVYLRSGLLPEPVRTGRNVADYAEAHVEGIRLVRRLQKEEGLTLPQIRAMLAGGPAAAPVAAGAFPHLEQLVAARLDRFDALVPLSSVRKRNPQAERDAAALHRIGAIRLRRRAGAAVVSRTDAELVSIWGDMRRAGFDEAHGFDAGILGFYVEAAERLAETEVSQFLDAVTGRAGESEAASMAFEAINRMLHFFGLLRTKAVIQAFARRSPATRRKRGG